MKKLGLIVFVLMLLAPFVLAQDTEIDVTAYLDTASIVFMTGIGGLSVLGIVEVLKRMLKIQGIMVRVISVIVSAGAVAVYEIGLGFLWYRALILLILVSLAANGIYLFPKKRTAY